MADAPTILLVDDSLSSQGELGAGLIAAGFEVKVASTAREAILTLIDGCVSLVLYNATTPGLADLDFIELLREDMSWKDLPVIVLVDHEQDVDRLPELQRLGIEMCVAKTPDTIRHLPRIVREIIKA